MALTLRASVLRSFDAPAPLFPFLDRLFLGLPALGSSPRRIVRCLARAGICARHRVLDLACGKGAATLLAARTLKCTTLGVDAFAPFIDAAELAARQHSLEHRCRWLVADVRKPFPTRGARFDAAMMIGLDSLQSAAPRLRRLVRPGGIYIIDDLAAMQGRWRNDPLTRGVPSRRDAAAFITNLGDLVLESRPHSPTQSRALAAAIHARLRINARTLAAQHPRLRPALRTFLLRQAQGGRLTQGPLRPVIWVVRRGSTPR